LKPRRFTQNRERSEMIPTGSGNPPQELLWGKKSDSNRSRVSEVRNVTEGVARKRECRKGKLKNFSGGENSTSLGGKKVKLWANIGGTFS